MVEWDQVDAAPNAVVCAPNLRPVVAKNPELELRRKVEFFLVEETRADPIAAGQGLDHGFVQTPTGIGFAAYHHASAMHARNVVAWRAVFGSLGKGCEARPLRIVAQHRLGRFDEGGFAIRTDAMKEEKPVLADVTCER